MRWVIDGPIGAGKSAVLAELGRRGHEVQPEPVEEWTLLPRFYADRARHAFGLQVQIALSMARRPTPSAGARAPTFVERDRWSSLEVFGHLAPMAPEERAVLRSVHESLPEEISHGRVLLKIDAETSAARVARRGRPCERDVDAGYLGLVVRRYAEVERHFTHVIDATRPVGAIADEITRIVSGSTGAKAGGACSWNR